MTSIRESYINQGVIPYYKANGSNYSNPHEEAIKSCLDVTLSMWKPQLNSVLDLAAGSGEISSHIKAKSVTGIDPYTGESYFKRTGKRALPYSFDDIVKGAIADHKYDLIVCSFAMHLLEESKLPALCYALAQISSKMLIISPHKKPVISWGWKICGEVYVNRIRARWYEN
jgi:SAM-dependent methyltransferase